MSARTVTIIEDEIPWVTNAVRIFINEFDDELYLSFGEYDVGPAVRVYLHEGQLRVALSHESGGDNVDAFRLGLKSDGTWCDLGDGR